MNERDRLKEELSRLVPGSTGREAYLRLDDAALASKVEQLKAEAARVEREGHIDTSGIGLRPVDA